MVRHAKPSTDQIGHTTSGPQVGPKTVGRRFLSEPTKNLPFLMGGQKSWPPWRWLRRQTVIPIKSMPGYPLRHGDWMHTEKVGNIHLRPAAVDFLNCQPTTSF
jgi:hypothetical protein